VMTEALQKLGFQIKVENDPDEFCNRTITVKGLGGKIPKAGTAEEPLELFVGNAGTAARFMAAFVCLGDGVYRLSGVPRMHERPQAAVFSALRELGYRVESEKGNDKLPVKIFGRRRRREESQTEGESKSLLTSSPTEKKCRVSIEESSQFASALLLSAKTGGWEIEIVGENADESPYVAMTSKLMEIFPWNGGSFQIEPDASSGSYFLAAGHMELFGKRKVMADYPNVGKKEVITYDSHPTVRIPTWPRSGWQIDQKYLFYFMSTETLTHGFLSTHDDLSEAEILNLRTDTPRTVKVSRLTDLGDSIMTAIVTSPFLIVKFADFTDLGRLRVQECERVVALRTELTKCGVKVIEEGDTLTVYPAKPEELHGAEIETYNDHRMAMCFAVLGLKIPGIKIKNPACVKKTFPNFFQKLAAPAPQGLGVTILDGKTGRKLDAEDLFAD
jgi:3-phosphoshikimate 1-carboxyvinyltransferase